MKQMVEVVHMTDLTGEEKKSPEHSKKISIALKDRKPKKEEIRKSVEAMIDKVYRGEDKKTIKIDQYDLGMNFIKTWTSTRRIVAETRFCYRGI